VGWQRSSSLSISGWKNSSAADTLASPEQAITLKWYWPMARTLQIPVADPPPECHTALGNAQIFLTPSPKIRNSISRMEATMSTSTEHLTDWLRDAHAMEQQAETLLKGEIKRIKNYPELTQRLEQELQKTLTHQEQMKQCLTRLDAKTSTVKDLGAKALAFAQDMSGLFVADEVVKAALSLYVFTHMGVSSYKILTEAATVRADAQTRQTCEGLMKSKQEFADWLLEYMPQLTREFLQRSDVDSKKAKR
jgi:ferritin-like metal-binding protein YciE